MQVFRDPPILFFLLGLLSVFFKTGLRIPMVLSKFFSFYLLMAIGFKGGVSIFEAGLSSDFVYALSGGLFLSVLMPVLVFYCLKGRLSPDNAGALAATYGSVSAVTFVAASNWLEARGLNFSGSMIAVLALMEAPAIMVGLLLRNVYSQEKQKTKVGPILHEALFNGSVFLLLGSVVVGYVSGPVGAKSLSPFIWDLFKGFLGFFLLDLGIKAGTTIRRMAIPMWLLPVGVAIPIIGALLAFLWGRVSGIAPNETFLLMTLAAGASYIAVPAALKNALPRADAGLYLTMALGVTFPFNILIGLPLYWWIVNR